MAHTLSLLSSALNPPMAPTPPPVPDQLRSGRDFVVILAALCCAILAAVGLSFLARCSSLHRRFGLAAAAQPPPLPMGLRRATFRLLPTSRYSSRLVGSFTSDCPICLTEFLDGDLMRVLPLCGHVFHVRCIDTWLGCRASCPSCRRLVAGAAAPWRLCGGSQRRPGGCSAATDDREVGLA